MGQKGTFLRVAMLYRQPLILCRAARERRGPQKGDNFGVVVPADQFQLTPGKVLTPQEKAARAELARRIKAAAAKGERDQHRLKLLALRAILPSPPLR